MVLPCVNENHFARAHMETATTDSRRRRGVDPPPPVRTHCRELALLSSRDGFTIGAEMARTPRGRTSSVNRIRRRRMSDAVAAQIKEMIYVGALQPGERLPSERDLADQLKVGRPTIREAIQQLRGIGLIEVKGPRGTYIRPTQPTSLETPAWEMMRSELEIIVKIGEIRTAMESWVAAEAARRATAKEIADLKRTVAGLEAAARRGDSAAVTEFDLAFHVAVLRMTKNRVMLGMREMLTSMLTSMRALSNLTPFATNARVLVDHQRDVAEAIAKHDPDAARRAMVQHLQTVTNMFRAIRLPT